MRNLAGIVRPVLPASVGILTRPRRGEKTQVDETPRLTIVASGNFLNNGSTSSAQTVTTIWASERGEQSRIYDKVKIKNPEAPDDETQYLEAEVTKQVTMGKFKGQGRGYPVSYGEQEESETVEIVERNQTRNRNY